MAGDSGDMEVEISSRVQIHAFAGDVEPTSTANRYVEIPGLDRSAYVELELVSRE